MWLLHFLPDSLLIWFCNIVLLLGLALTAAGLVAHRIPVVWRYQLPFRIASIVLLVAGVYFRGGLAVETEWRERVTQMQERIKTAEEQSKSANDELGAKAESKVKYVKGRTEYITKYIDKEVVKYDTKFAPGGACEIPAEFVAAHNQAAEAPKK